MPLFQTLRSANDVQDNLRREPSKVLALAYNDAACEDQETRHKLHNRMASELEAAWENPGGETYSGVILPEGLVLEPNHKPPTCDTWVQCVQNQTSIVPIVHQPSGSLRSADSGWYETVHDRGVQAVHASAEIGVTELPSSSGRRKLHRLARIAKMSQQHGLFPIVGPVISRDGDYNTPMFKSALKHALQGLRKKFDEMDVFTDLVGVQVNYVHARNNSKASDLGEKAAADTNEALAVGLPEGTETVFGYEDSGWVAADEVATEKLSIYMRKAEKQLIRLVQYT